MHTEDGVRFVFVTKDVWKNRKVVILGAEWRGNPVGDIGL